MAELAAAGASSRGPARPLLRRRSGWLLLGVITLLHLLAADELVSDRFGWGEGERPPARIEVAFVRELVQAAPVPMASPKPPAVAQRALPSVAAEPAVPASAAVRTPRPVEIAPEVVTPPSEPPPVLVQVPPPSPPLAAVTEAPPAATVAPPVEPIPPLPEPSARTSEPPLVTPAPAATASAQPFEWPPSTQLSYTLSGYYRGPIEGGRAQVEWLRSGSRYQVRLEASVGPLFSRRIVSEGELTERGLVPRRFDGEQKVMLRAPRRWSQQFGPERITLADGREVEALPGAQDEASQFVQLTWLFTTQPALLQVGKSIEVPLAINRRFDRWIYDIKAEQTLTLSFGSVQTYHVRPRREAKGGDMTAEIWIAPSLQYLPVRILIRQDESTFIDLTLDKPPLQAAK